MGLNRSIIQKTWQSPPGRSCSLRPLLDQGSIQARRIAMAMADLIKPFSAEKMLPNSPCHRQTGAKSAVLLVCHVVMPTGRGDTRIQGDESDRSSEEPTKQSIT